MTLQKIALTHFNLSTSNKYLALKNLLCSLKQIIAQLNLKGTNFATLNEF